MQIPDNIRDYVKVYEFLDKDDCRSVVAQLEQLRWRRHEFYHHVTGKLHSSDHDLSVSFDEFPDKQRLQDSLRSLVDRYIFQDFGNFEWFRKWQGYTRLRVNRYEKDTMMDIHCDHIHSIFDGNLKGVPILTILGSFNDEYTGGELLMWGDEVVELPAGSVMIFPSNFLYPHKINPVISGVRYSFVSWVW